MDFGKAGAKIFNSLRTGLRVLWASVSRRPGAYLLALMLALLVYLVFGPLLIVLATSLKPTGFLMDAGFSLSNFRDVFLDPWTGHLLQITLVFAVGTAVVAAVLSLLLAFLLQRTNVPGRGLANSLIIMPMAVPPLLLAISWVLLLSPKIGAFNQVLVAAFGLKEAPLNIYSLYGMIFVSALALVPSAFLMIRPVLGNMDPNLEEAAFTSGAGVLSTLRRVSLPLIRPGLLAMFIYLFIVGLVMFDIPGIIGMPRRLFVFSSLIYFESNPPSGLPRYGAVCAMALLYLVILFAGAYLYSYATREARKFTTITGKGFRPRIFDLREWRYPAAGFIWLYFFLAVLAPLAILGWASLLPFYQAFSLDALPLMTLKSYKTIFILPTVQEAAKNTFILVIVASIAVAILSALISWIVVRTQFIGRRLLDILAFLPVAMPGVVIGLALLLVYLYIRVLPIYGTIWIIVIAHVTHFIAYGTRTTNSVMFQIHRELEEAAQTSGASWLRVFRRIVLPLMMPALLGLLLWVAAHSMRELASALMLRGRENAVISTLIWGFWQSGRVPETAAMGVLLIIVLLILTVILQWMSRRAGVSLVAMPSR